MSSPTARVRSTRGRLTAYALSLAALLICACRPPAAAPADAGPEVRFRPEPEPPNDLARWIVSRVPGATWDRGLARAASALTAAARTPQARLTPRATALALGEAGYPAPAKFALEINGGGWPEGMAEAMAEAALRVGRPAQVALAKRAWGDGTTLWIGGLASPAALVDPMPRDLALDGTLPLRVEPERGPLTLFIASPDGAIREEPLAPEHYLWLGGFHTPGTWRLEVVAGPAEAAEVALLWNVHVDAEPAAVPTLVAPADPTLNPMEATEALYDALNALRAESGLRPVARFEGFEPLAREHSALMAAEGVIGHTIPGVTRGVAAKAEIGFHPRARLYEDIAAASSWRDAMDLVALSPGHLRNLLCAACTHASIGVALEPTLDYAPRLFVTWELIEPQGGLPQPLEVYDR